MMSKFKLASILFFISTLFLKFSSMFRDIVIAHQFGAGDIVGAYNAAMTIPNTFILFMLSGMKDAFVPSYLKYDKQNQGFSHLTNIVKGTFYIGLLISLAGAAFSPLLIHLLFPTFRGDIEQLAIWTSIMYFFSIFLVGINAVFEGYFDAKGKYSFSTFSQTVVVLSTIGSTLFLSKLIGGYSIALGYLVGTFISFLIKFFYFGPRKFINWRQKMNIKEVNTFYLIFIPVGITIMVGQINLNISNFYAGMFGADAISYLNYAFRLVSIPQAIFGVTVATIIYPIIATARTNNDIELFKTGMEKGLSIMFLFLAPTVSGMMLMMEEVIQIVYQRGAFDGAATVATSEVAYYYVGSVLFYSIQVIIAKGFYTLDKGNLIMRIGILSILLNIVFNFVFSSWIGYKGLALSTSVVGFIYTFIAFFILNKHIGWLSVRKIGKEYVKIIFSCIVMIVVLWIIKHLFEQFHVFLYVTTLTIIGAGIYFIMLWALKTTSLYDIVAMRSSNKKQ